MFGYKQAFITLYGRYVLRHYRTSFYYYFGSSSTEEKEQVLY